ncbi:hypothetical protein [Prosthecobacter sp.]|uniref:hypothetical protein n=1 Tax=Prosthecobacter sp. TaxID=1965333 RepID=UPI002ABAD444|nr:hypothetical protein [Prosthecobacter sp.]MDZ4404332.1 hypothetical protein [Prosthecobacter sp.]
METPLPPQRGAFIAKLGAWLQLVQLYGVAIVVASMNRAFRELGSNGGADPTKLSAAIGEILIGVFSGIIIALPGLLLIIIAITALRYRAVWMFWFLCIYGGLMTFSYLFPVGLFFLIYALVKKDEFLRLQQPSAPSIQFP